MLSLFQQSYKGFKGNFLKIRCNKKDSILLDGFPLYWSEEPRFQGARRLEDLPQRDQEVCRFLSSLKVVFETAFLVSREFTPGSSKGLYWYPSFSTLDSTNFIIVNDYFLSSFTYSMLARIDKKELAERAKRMKVAAQAPQDLKLKAPTTIVLTSTEDDEEINPGLIFKRKRKAIDALTEHSHSDGRAPSNCAPSTSPTQPRNMMVVQKDEGMSFREKGLWYLDLDVPSFLEKTLLPNEEKEKLMTLEEDRLVQETMRQLGQALAASFLVATKLKVWRGSAIKRLTRLLSSISKWRVFKKSFTNQDSYAKRW